jgi:lipoyl(octanoyl) transferase
MKADRGKGASLEAVEWRVSGRPEPYIEAVAAMESRVAAIRAGTAPEMVWLLEHPPVYTAGTSAVNSDLIDPRRFPVFQTGRGGRMTYHGPGQRVIYVLLDLRRRGQDVHKHVRKLEEWIIRVLADFGVRGERRRGRVGIWVAQDDGREEKIAALGIRVRRWVTYHGLALNVKPDLSHYSGIVPCGLAGYGITSLHALGAKAAMEEIDQAFKRHWASVFERENTAQDARN